MAVQKNKNVKKADKVLERISKKQKKEKEKSKKQKEIAKKLLDRNMKIEEITEITGLSKEEVKMYKL